MMRRCSAALAMILLPLAVVTLAHAQAKRARKGCDWILANDVSPGTQAFGGDSNILHLITADGAQTWPRQSKADIGTRLAGAIARHFHKN